MTGTAMEIDAKTAKGWLDQERAVFIDIREPDEFAREHIPQAYPMPLSGFGATAVPGDRSKVAVFHCASGHRTREAAARIQRSGFREVYQLKDGIAGWKKAGFETLLNRRAPISIIRQVQIVAGSLVLLGTVLGWLVSPWFFAVSAFVGAGLTFAGISGTCAMAEILGRLPFNRRVPSTGA